MSDSILAAIIAATATLSASLLQLRFSIARELAARAQGPVGRKKSRAPFIVLFVMVGAAAVAGFCQRAHGAVPVLVNGEAAIAWAPGRQVRVLFRFTAASEKITAVELIADPESLRRLDLVIPG